MHGVAELQHDVVGDVHQVVQRTQTHPAQPGGQPVRGGADLDAGDHPRHEAVAQVGLVDLDLDLLRGLPAGLLQLEQGSQVSERIAGDRGQLPRQAPGIHAVGAVATDIQVKDRVALDLLDAVHRVACGGEALGDLLGGQLGPYVILEPFETELHFVNHPGTGTGT